jgi:hypothetical protein
MFISATQTTPITNVRLWSKVTNLAAVNKVLAVSSQWVAVWGSNSFGKEGIFVFDRSSKPRQARYLDPKNISISSLSSLSSESSEFLLTSNYLYYHTRSYLYRIPLTTTYITSPLVLRVEKILSSSGSLLTYATTDNYLAANMAFSSDRQAIYVSIPDEGTGAYISVTYKISDLDAAIPTMASIGKAHPTTWELESCDWFYQDKCYALITLETAVTPHSLYEFDPATETTINLWPNTSDEGMSLSYGEFDNVQTGYMSGIGKSIITLNDRAYFFYRDLYESACLVMEIDLTNKILARHAGNGECALTNDANLESSFETDTYFVMDDATYYYAFNLDTAIYPALSTVRQVELDPVGERVNTYCGSDNYDLSLKNLYDSLSTTTNDIKSFMSAIFATHGGSIDEVEANNWVDMTVCESTSGTHETVPPGGTSSRTIDTVSSQIDDASRYFDGYDAIVLAPATTKHESGTDADGDGVYDADDEFPDDATESVDFDRDGTGDNADTDDDGDGVSDTSDAFPYDRNESSDTDGDGIGDNADD